MKKNSSCLKGKPSISNKDHRFILSRFLAIPRVFFNNLVLVSQGKLSWLTYSNVQVLEFTIFKKSRVRQHQIRYRNYLKIE